MNYTKLVKFYPDLANDERLTKLDFILASRIQNLIDWDGNMFDGYIGNPEYIKNQFDLYHYSLDEIVDSLNHLIDCEVFNCKKISPKGNQVRYMFTSNVNYDPLNYFDVDEETGEVLS